MKPVFADKDYFESRGKSKVTAFLGTFGRLRFSFEEKIKELICQLICSKIFKLWAETKVEDFKPLLTVKCEFQYRHETF